jgi:hypothetical protein
VRKSLASYFRDARGFSINEAAAVLTVSTMLSSVAAPAISNYVDDARLVRGRHDARAIATAMVRLMTDVGPDRNRPGGWATFALLVGPGPAPAAGTRESASWIVPSTAKGVSTLDDHLNTNGPGYAAGASAGPNGWRGAYLQDPVASDPWGHRYAINVQAMHGAALDTVVLSGGPDGIVTSPFERDGLPTEGDDITAHVASNGLR